MASIGTILDWFKTGKKPTQTQFWESWQSFWHKDEIIPQASVEDLTSSLNLKADKNGTLSFKGDIPNTANLNDYVGSGLYLQGANVYAAAGTNYPIAEAGMLEVVANPDFIYQKYHAYGPNNEIFYRTYYSPVGWYPWKKNVSENELVDLRPEIVHDFNVPIGFKTLEANFEANNTPGIGAWGAGIQFSTNKNPDYINQLVFDILGNLYTRSKYDTSWGVWQKILTSESSIEINRTGGFNDVGEANRNNKVWFDYAPLGLGTGYAGSVISWSGLSGNYPVQITADYGTGNNIFFRTKNGDYNIWNPARRLWHNGDFTLENINNWNTISSKANDINVLHNTGDEIKSGSITIDGNNRGYYLGNAGHNASIVYNGNGNLDITPRAGYNTIITEGKVGIGNQNPSSKLSVDGDLFINANNTTDYRTAAFGNKAYDGSMGTGENRVYFQWADFDAAYIGAYKHTFNTSGLSFGTQYGFGNVHEKMRLDQEGRLLLGLTEPINNNKLQVLGDATFKCPDTWGGLNLDSSSVTGGNGVNFFGGGVMYSQVTGEYLSPDNGMSIFRNRQNGNLVENMRIVGNTGNILIGTPFDNNLGTKLQINGRASGVPALYANEFVTKSQLDTQAPTILTTEVELTIPLIGGFDYYEEYVFFDGAKVGDFVDMVMPISFNIPFLDIKCLCIDDNKIMVRFTTLSQNYFSSTTDTFKFRIIK